MIFEEGKVCENTSLFDVGLQGVKGISGIYYLETGEKSCVIDSGDPAGAKMCIKKLKSMGKPLPDFILLTHAHWDHSQGIPIFRKRSPSVQVFASERSVDLLEDQSFNKVFEKIPMKNIFDVNGLKNGEKIDLGNTQLQVIEIPGHTEDHIGYYDHVTKTFFAGDSIGIRVGEKAYIPPSMPPFFNEEKYFETLNKLKEMDIETLCITHFGYIPREEIPNFLDEMCEFYELSRKIMNQVLNKPDLEPSLTQLIMEELQLEIPRLDTFDKKIPIILGIVNMFRRIRGKTPIHVGHIMTPKFANYALEGYKMSLSPE
jgi:glyoxylase-like metal-dependent hydrolase (beta-lactamase superfamily II)